MSRRARWISAGLVVRDRHTRTTHVYDLTYQFDAAGRRISALYPSGELVATTYDLSGRPQEMRYTPSGGGQSQDFVKTIRHQVNGPIRSFRTAGNLLEARTFDMRRRRL